MSASGIQCAGPCVQQLGSPASIGSWPSTCGHATPPSVPPPSGDAPVLDVVEPPCALPPALDVEPPAPDVVFSPKKETSPEQATATPVTPVTTSEMMVRAFIGP